MNFERMPEPIDALVITDTLSNQDTVEVMAEARTLLKRDTGEGCWLNDVYKEIDASFINQSVMDTFFTDSVVSQLASINSMYGLFNNVNQHSSVLNYYGDSQGCPTKYDSAAFIIKTFLFDEPKNFTGGNLTLQIGAEVAYERDIENNMSILFPASYYYKVSPVEVLDKDIPHSGLYTVTTYLFINP